MTIRLRNTVDSWGATARWLHWLIAALVLVQFVIGSVAEEMTLTPTKLDLFVWHKSIGVSVLLLAVIRLAWRLGNPPPALPDVLSSADSSLPCNQASLISPGSMTA